MVEPRKGFDENISTFVREFISPRSEEIDRLVQIKIIVTEMKSRSHFYFTRLCNLTATKENKPDQNRDTYP